MFVTVQQPPKTSYFCQRTYDPSSSGSINLSLEQLQPRYGIWDERSAERLRGGAGDAEDSDDGLSVSGASLSIASARPGQTTSISEASSRASVASSRNSVARPALDYSNPWRKKSIVDQYVSGRSHLLFANGL